MLTRLKKLLARLYVTVLVVLPLGGQQRISSPDWTRGSTVKMENELVVRYGPSQRDRIHRGLAQVAPFWLAEDGDSFVF